MFFNKIHTGILNNVQDYMTSEVKIKQYIINQFHVLNNPKIYFKNVSQLGQYKNNKSMNVYA